MIIMIRLFVKGKNHIACLKVKVTLYMFTWFIGCSDTCLCLIHNFVLHGGISKLFGKMNMTRQHVECKNHVEGLGHTVSMNFVHSL